MAKKQQNQGVVIYRTKAGAIELRGDYSTETIWATQAQIADVFGIERSVVTKHIQNILKIGEISERGNVQKMHTASSDKPVAFYSLDIALAVGYRANSARAIDFRRWATKVLRAHIVDGYTINRSRIAKNYDAFAKAIADVRALLPAGTAVNNADIVELISLFADTWLSLDAYDREKFSIGRATRKRVAFAAQKLTQGIQSLKRDLMQEGTATDFFARERTAGALEGIVGNVLQSFGGKDVYGSVEEKAAHLLYFIVKDHPFIDGNKRTGAYSFVWFLRTANALDTTRITPPALTAITLLIAESNPRDSEKMISLVAMLLAGRRAR
jgi:prophage maintenance system killer protein/prophage antirepressor-like protein